MGSAQIDQFIGLTSNQVARAPNSVCRLANQSLWYQSLSLIELSFEKTSFKSSIPLCNGWDERIYRLLPMFYSIFSCLLFCNKQVSFYFDLKTRCLFLCCRVFNFLAPAIHMKLFLKLAHPFPPWHNDGAIFSYVDLATGYLPSNFDQIYIVGGLPKPSLELCDLSPFSRALLEIWVTYWCIDFSSICLLHEKCVCSYGLKLCIDTLIENICLYSSIPGHYW